MQGMNLWKVIICANPQSDFGFDAEGNRTNGDHPDYGWGEMVAEVICNNAEYANVLNDNEEFETWIDNDSFLAVTSDQFIQILNHVATTYDIANYVVKDGRVWAREEQCWAEDL